MKNKLLHSIINKGGYILLLSLSLSACLNYVNSNSLTRTQEYLDRRDELIDMGYPGNVIRDQLYEEFDHVNGPNGTGGIDGLLLDGTPANGSNPSAPKPTSQPSTQTPAQPKHKHDWTPEVTKESTCKEKGTITYHCSGCSDTYDEGIPFADHDWQASEVSKATCLEKAKTTFICPDCGEAMDIEEGEFGEHIYIPTDKSYDATCIKNGKKYYECNVCHDTYDEVVEAYGHVWNDTYTIDKEASCIEEGKKSIHCKNCSEIKEGSEVDLPVVPHSEDENHVMILEPSFFNTGTEIVNCKVCGKELDTIVIPATGKISYILIPVGALLILAIAIVLITFIRKLFITRKPLKN